VLHAVDSFSAHGRVVVGHGLRVRTNLPALVPDMLILRTCIPHATYLVASAGAFGYHRAAS
jgi:hypothetical protein